PADVVGFYGSISSSIPRLYEISTLYKKLGVITVAGGKHIENMPLEALYNDIDVVVFREGEVTIKELLLAIENNQDFNNIKGIAFLKENKIFKTPERPLIDDLDSLPYPDFNLMRYEKMHFYPVNRTRGCNSNCEFCAVKDKARSSSPEYMINQIKYLVETREASYFFEASDHFAANREETIEFCKLLASYQKKINKRLVFTVQTRITDARYPELLEAMKEANIDTVCIGYESPIDEELISMRKGYLSKDLFAWTETFHKYGFFVHGMFIFGYPSKNLSSISLEERIKLFSYFIKKAKIDTIQVLNTIPLPGTELRKRLENENRIFPLGEINWQYYDGQYPLFIPDGSITATKMQNAIIKIMKKFYGIKNILKAIYHIVFHFPVIIFPASLTIISGNIKLIIKAFNFWYRNFFRNYSLRSGGYIVAKKWLKNFKKDNFLLRLENIKLK
ncbi:MAG: B12-binding domain-containing radical SAM protein, partial [Candidatus Micrarchaeota archaeon]|nr:B12-binding domain-containing radical SAM protein [Candidatus Micrarchaeota archaeon]